MRESILALTIAGLFVTLPVAPASAGPGQNEEANGTAEQQLRHRLQADPDDHVMLARLARLYAATGRPAKAKRLYSAMMSLEDVALERMGGSPVSSRLLASSALRQIDAAKPVRIGSR